MKTSELIKILQDSIEDNGDQEVHAWEALRLCVPLLKNREPAPPEPALEPPAPRMPMDPDSAALADMVAKQGHGEVRARFG